jgi:acyl-CoA thioester hydrolase
MTEAFRVTDERPPFRFAARTRVGFDETDAQGVVYYGRYMPYFDRARVAYSRHLGLLEVARGPRQFVMRANHVSYHAPAGFDDVLDVFVRVARIGTSSVVWELAAYHEDGTLLCTAEQTLVHIDVAARRPIAVPEPMRRTVEEFERVAPAGPRTAAGDGEARRSGAVEAVERILNREGEADQILRQAVEVVARRYDTFCGIRFVEEQGLVLGPAAGPPADPVERVPVPYEGAVVAELVLGRTIDDLDRTALERIATLVSPYCLVGWDTGGEAWHP